MWFFSVVTQFAERWERDAFAGCSKRNVVLRGEGSTGRRFCRRGTLAASPGILGVMAVVVSAVELTVAAIEFGARWRNVVEEVGMAEAIGGSGFG